MQNAKNAADVSCYRKTVPKIDKGRAGAFHSFGCGTPRSRGATSMGRKSGKAAPQRGTGGKVRLNLPTAPVPSPMLVLSMYATNAC